LNNNNRGNSNSMNNNRRRGRGNNNRPQGGGGGQQLNRIDSRARGNASQLLEKYRKLAQDAHLNGDRVSAEYYLQFADHYFRVLADSRVRQDEPRGARPERWQEGDPETDDSGEFSVESDFPSFDQQPVAARREREDRPNDRGSDDRGNNRPAANERSNERPRRDREDRPERAPRQEAAPPARNDDARNDVESPAEDSAAEAAPSATPYEPAENPFVRDRGTRGLRPRRDDRRPRRDEEDDAPAGLDPSMLPPAISIPRDESEIDVEVEVEAAEVKPRRRAPRKKPAGDDTGETLESVS
jgi:hypothetical protein